MLFRGRFCFKLFLLFQVCTSGLADKADKGLAVVRDYSSNKGLVYSAAEREALRLRGLLPARVLTQEEQLEWCSRNVERISDDLEKYIYLRDLQDSNEKLFYQCLIQKVDVMLPIVYTPIVGLACQNYGLIYRRPRGMFISIKDKGNVEKLLRNWPTKDVRAIVVTDGERILGLGDLGANGMGIPVGKMAIYTAMGGIHPQHCLPVTLDVGTNNEEFLKPRSTYIGLQEKRGPEGPYTEFVDEFMKSVVKVFNRYTLIQFEDFANQNAFRLLKRYRNDYTMFNDDIQGTAAVAVAGILAAGRVTGKRIADSKILFFGSGTAAVGIANLLVDAMGEDPEVRRKQIYMTGRSGLVKRGDKGCDDKDGKGRYCHELPAGVNVNDLDQIIKWMKPNVLIGVSGTKGLFTESVLRAMAEVTERPVIFPLSNPTDNSECTAEEAYKHTKGKCLFASGSPFPPVNVNGSMKSPQQCNNAYIFPGVALGITTTKMKTVPDEVFLVAARTLAEKCTQESDFERGSLFPPLALLRDCSVKIAVEIAEYAFQHGLATVKRPSTDMNTFITCQQYNPDYDVDNPNLNRNCLQLLRF